MHVAHRRRAALVVMLMSASVVLHASDSPQDAFAKRWEGKSVTVRYPLYSLVYNERGKLGNTRNNLRDGLTVVTAAGGMYFQFDGRQSRSDVVGQDPKRIVDAVSVEYQPDSLEARPYRKIEPLLLTRYDPGVELLVKNVRVDRDSVRLIFARAGGPDASDDTATSLTVKWPVPLSKSFSERDLVEGLIRRFVDYTTPRP